MFVFLIFILTLVPPFPEPIPPLPITPPTVLYLPEIRKEPQPISFTEGVSCTRDIYNCDDFADWNEAQLVYQFCMVQGLGDPHGLDRDADNFACESLPNPWR